MLPNQTIILSVSSKMFLEVKPSLKTYITVSTEDCWLIVRWKQHSLCLIYCKFLYGFLLCYTNRDQTVSEIVIMSNFHQVIKINVTVLHGDFEVVFASPFLGHWELAYLTQAHHRKFSLLDADTSYQQYCQSISSEPCTPMCRCL